METLIELSETGINPSMLEKSLNHIEFGFRNNKTKDFGEHMMSNILEYYLNDELDFEFLQIKENMRKIRFIYIIIDN